MMVGAWWAWIVAVCLYGVFRLWYDNRRGPLSKAEIDHFMAAVARMKLHEHTDPAVMRSFLEADDGKEFVMSNLVRIHPGEVPHPATGDPTPGLALFRAYVKRFVKILFRHGGHPLLAMRKVGGYVDAWDTPPDPGWSVVGAMRYRSRRDLIAMVLDPSLRDVHALKTAGTAMTFSFPTQVIVSMALGPRAAVALLLALAAAVVHLVSVAALLPR